MIFSTFVLIMKVEILSCNNLYSPQTANISEYKYNQTNSVCDTLNLNLNKHRSNSDVSFGANPIQSVKEYLKYLKVQKYTNGLVNYIRQQNNHENLFFRNISMEQLEGLQYGIKVFKGLTMKDIQYLSENLHVIAVKRGCNNMCGYCYADAKPSNREMSCEDFTTITQGFKTLRKRLGNLPLFGENLPTNNDPIFLTTEAFYDADCMNIAIKNKRNKLFDMRDIITEIYESMGRKSCFDTSGWNPENKIMQDRAEQYAQYFSEQKNMDKLNAFNISFNPFNVSYIAGVKALKNGDVEKFRRLKDKFTDRIANAIYTFTPLLKSEKFGIMSRSFGLNSINADYFDFAAMYGLVHEVSAKLEKLYQTDLNKIQKFVKKEEDIKFYVDIAIQKMSNVSTALNSSGRMKQFMETFGIKDNIKLYDDDVNMVYDNLVKEGRYHRILSHRLIDTDGKVYHMNYAMFFPTEIQLNISNKTPAPTLANLREKCLITKEMINRKEELHTIKEFID